MLRLIMLLTAAALTACGVGYAQYDVDLLDYGRAFYYSGRSGVNHLYIEIQSRMLLNGEEYMLLYPHPREETFNNNGSAYKGAIEDAQGASEITFMLTRSGRNSMVTRRYDFPGQPYEYLHEMYSSPYGPLLFDPAKVPAGGVAPIDTFEALHAAAERGHPIFAVIQYVAGGTSVSIEFPVKVLNMNPNPAMPGQQWQLASSRIPIYVPNSDPNLAITNGHVAFSTLGSADLQFVYLCETTFPRLTQDYSCTVNYSGSVRLYERL